MPSMPMRKTRNYDRTGNLMYLKDMFCVHSDGFKDRNCAINVTLPRLTELNCQMTMHLTIQLSQACFSLT